MGLFDSIKDAVATSHLNPHIKHRGVVGGERVEDFWLDLEATFRDLRQLDLIPSHSAGGIFRLLVLLQRYEILHRACLHGCDPNQSVGNRIETAVNATRPSRHFDDDFGGIELDSLDSPRLREQAMRALMCAAHDEAAASIAMDYRGIAGRNVRITPI